ncbi:MAG: transketolase [Brachymonas sp.]|nr:transketolase [Brachymonas sp.]MBP8821387.1 transketolase [Brachymonas sp.]
MANAIRALSMDAVEKAKSGHPGAPMGMADMAVALWSRHLRHNPANPKWYDRDRFVLSNGHASMLQYALLHLTGYDLPMEELKNFRQLGSKTAGHPEYGATPGVETTTGPLGQGLANAVGMALAEKLLAAEFNRPGFDVVNHNTYVMLGDGCMMEGISHEVCALAGAWKLNKLIALYDDNGISIDGHVQPWFVDDTAKRFEAYQWNVIGPVDGHDVDAVDQAIAQAKQSATKPTLIICRTTIGKGAPNRQNTAKVHGEPLGAEEVKLARETLGWKHAPFEIPDDLYQAWDARAEGAEREEDWEELFAGYVKEFPLLASELRRRMDGAVTRMVQQLAERMPRVYQPHAPAAATRKACQMALESFTAHFPELLGGSADLTGSNLTSTQNTPPLRFADDGSVVKVDDGSVILTDKSRVSESAKPGRHINYGVREFGMAAIMNGIALHGGYIPYGGTFLTFSDYSRNAIRMAALMKLRVIHVFTHDSIGLGEDGPTHQSIEHAASLRLIPNLDVWRPCDVVEAAIAWASALQNDKRPTAMLLSRQSVPYMNKDDASLVARGGYVLAGPSHAGLNRPAEAVIIATGSEVQLAMRAQEVLARRDIAVRVVSMPSTSVFDRQTPEYKEMVLPSELPRIAVEMGVSDYWWKYGCAAVVGIDSFGESAPAETLYEHFGFTPENVADTVQAVLGR